jgi:uncharacterized membrane protein YdfJ with MMPL/SSD domain
MNARLSTRALALAGARHPWRTIAAWTAVAVLAAVAIGALLPGALISGGNPINNPQSQRARDALRRDFPATASAATTDVIIVSSRRYSVDAPAFRSLVRSLASAGRVSDVTSVRTYLGGGGARLVSRSRHAAMIPLAIPNRQSSSNVIATVISTVRRANAVPGFAVSVTGQQTVSHDLNTLAKKDLSSGELRIGLPAALIVLLAVFGAVAAALLPLLLAGMAIVVALAGVALLAHAFALSIFVTNILTGMGLALGIDYALFIVSRYREERGGGLDKLAAIAASGATAGRAVLFSGTTFVIAMFGMFLVPNEVMRSIAVGAILVGLFSVIAALTLLPAVLGLLGDRVDRLRIPLIGKRSRANPEGRFWAAIVGGVLRRPLLGLVMPTAVLVLAASPIFGMHVGTSGVTVLPQGSESRQGYAALRRDFPGATAEPATIVVANGASQPGTQQALQRLRT